MAACHWLTEFIQRQCLMSIQLTNLSGVEIQVGVAAVDSWVRGIARAGGHGRGTGCFGIWGPGWVCLSVVEGVEGGQQGSSLLYGELVLGW